MPIARDKSDLTRPPKHEPTRRGSTRDNSRHSPPPAPPHTPRPLPTPTCRAHLPRQDPLVVPSSRDKSHLSRLLPPTRPTCRGYCPRQVEPRPRPPRTHGHARARREFDTSPEPRCPTARQRPTASVRPGQRSQPRTAQPHHPPDHPRLPHRTSPTSHTPHQPQFHPRSPSPPTPPPPPLITRNRHDKTHLPCLFPPTSPDPRTTIVHIHE